MKIRQNTVADKMVSRCEKTEVCLTMLMSFCLVAMDGFRGVHRKRALVERMFQMQIRVTREPGGQPEYSE